MSQTTTAKVASGAADFADTRIGAAKLVKAFARKTFPDHWSFLIGEIALYSFIILLITGTFLTLFFIPSVGETTYHGIYVPLQGQRVSEAFNSTVRISFDIRGGLLMRQIHHWSAILFASSIIVHMFRVFFTGAFRKPRELNWLIGSILVVLSMFEGFAGYSLPDDLLSGNGLRIASGLVSASPVVGSYMSFFLFGGEFPGAGFIPRLYTIHVLLLPAVFLALITAHLILLVVHKHTQYPGPGRTNDNVVGFPLFPVYMAKAGGYFFIVFGVTALLSSLFQINPIWAYGSYDPSPISAGAQPDFYMGFLDGVARAIPGAWEFTLGGHTISANILPALAILPLLLLPMMAYPWIEAWVSRDKREHHLLDRPRNMPVRTGLGMMAITLYTLFWISGGNDIVATHLQLSINDITNSIRVLVIALPPIVFWITKRLCLSLQRKDREKVLHGRETGTIFRTETGEYFEVHAPLSEFARWNLVQFEAFTPITANGNVDANGVRRKAGRLDGVRRKISQFYFEDRVEPVTPAELASASHHRPHEAIDGADSHPAVEDH
jgi:ubiquinol-cytochrome c reductase cytochrome b subunit